MKGIAKYRIYALTAGVLIIAGAGAAKAGLGSYCSVCPVGFLQITAASRSMPLDMLAGVITVLIAVLVLGRFFCGWLCTTALIRKVFPKAGSCQKASDRRFAGLPFAVLALALGISFIVRFPVFCLICPIGLFFGFIFALFRMFFVLEPSWNLLIFPAVIALEILIFKRWCSYICPVSAVFQLVSKIPFIRIRPQVNRETCITASGGYCSLCRQNCPEHIEVTNDKKAMAERCTSCMECAEVCPTASVSLKTVNHKQKKSNASARLREDAAFRVADHKEDL